MPNVADSDSARNGIQANILIGNVKIIPQKFFTFSFKTAETRPKKCGADTDFGCLRHRWAGIFFQLVNNLRTLGLIEFLAIKSHVVGSIEYLSKP